MARNSIQALVSWRLLALRRLSTSSLASAEATPSVAEATVDKAPAAVAGEKKEWKPLYRRLSALGGQPDGSVVRTLNKWIREGGKIRAEELMKYVKELRKYRRYRHALELMDWMVDTKGMNMSYTNHAIRLDLISKVRGIESAEKYFSSLPEPAKNERTYGSLLNCYCSAKQADKATVLYNEMKEKKIVSNTLVHTNIMSLYMKLGKPEMVATQFEEMKAQNVVPDNLTCCILMSSYAALNDIDSVESVLEEAEKGGKTTLQWSAYSTSAAIYSSAGLVQKAELALRKLEELLDKREREPFHFLISLYAGIGNLEEVNRVWKSLKDIFPKLTNMSYLTMLQALSKLNHTGGLKQVYEEWNSVYATYDLRLTNAILAAYLRNDMIEEAELLWENASEKGAVSDFRTCDLFLDYYVKKDSTGLALKWLEMATSMVKGNEWKLDEDKVNRFFGLLKEAKDVEGAEKLCKSLRALDCLDVNAYEMLLRIYLAAGKKEPSLRQRIEDDGIEVDTKFKRLLERVCK